MKRFDDAWRIVRASRARTLLTGLAAVVLILTLFLGVRSIWLGRTLLAPPPESVLDSEWVPELPLSTLNVPITYDLTPLVEKLEEAVDVRFGSIEDRRTLESNDRVSIAYEAEREPFSARLDGNVARVSTVLHYRGQGWYDAPLLPEVGASCGMPDDDGPRPRVVVELSAHLSLTSDWSLSADARVDRVAPLTDGDRDKCRVTPLEIDMTERVTSAAHDVLLDRIPHIEASLADIDLKSKFEEWWSILHEPIELTDDVWLAIDPVSVSRGATEGTGQELVASVGLKAQPRVILGSPPIQPIPALPPLDSAQISEGLRIHAKGRAEYENIGAELTRRLAGTTLESDGGTLQVRRLRVQGIGGGRLALEVSFDGTARGRVFLVGTPEFDPVSGQVHVPDLEFDVASLSLLVNSYAWLREPGITEHLRENARWPIEDLSSLAAEQLDRGLNRELTEGVRLIGAVSTVDILGVYARVDELIVHAQANARAELVIDDNRSSGLR